jgi:hypothetical protein
MPLGQQTKALRFDSLAQHRYSVALTLMEGRVEFDDHLAASSQRFGIVQDHPCFSAFDIADERKISDLVSPE